MSHAFELSLKKNLEWMFVSVSQKMDVSQALQGFVSLIK